MARIARLGDTSDHGGQIISVTETSMTCDGIPIARVGDMHSCPQRGHGTTPIISTPQDSASYMGVRIALVGSVCGCGAIIVTGSGSSDVT